MNPDCSPKSQATLTEVIESLGTGPYQFRTAILAGPVWFADGAELLLISSVTDVVSQQWGLGATQRALVVTFVYFGVLLGNLASGPFSDVLGRRLPILASYTFIFIFSICSALSWGFWSLCFFRVLVGASIGIGQPAQQALVSEVSPTKWRVIFSSCGQYLFVFGEIYAGLLLLADDPYLIHLHWRTLLVLAALPPVLFGVLGFFFLQQSPLYLSCTGRLAETQAILENIRRDNSAGDVSIDFRPARVPAGRGGESKLRRTLAVVFGSEYIISTLVMMASCFVVNLSYYGSLYAFPQILSKGVEVGNTPAAGLIYGALMEIVGYTVGIICILYSPRIIVMKLSVLAMALALASFAIGAPWHSGGTLAKILTYFGYYGTKLFVSIGYLIFYLYTSELYPTMARTTGTAVAFAGGRLGAMISPLVYELTTSWFGHYSVFFGLMASFCVANFFLHSLLTVETYGQVLNDAAESSDEELEDEPEKQTPSYGSF